MFEKKNLKQFQDRFREHFGKKSNKISEKKMAKNFNFESTLENIQFSLEKIQKN